MAGGNIGGWRKIQQLSLVPLYKNDDDFRLFSGMMDSLAYLPVPDLTNGIHLLRTLCPDDPPLSTLNWWITNGILLDNSTDSSFFLLTPHAI
jgi:hypothetical protein